MMIGGDDISNDVINLCTCFFNVCLHSRSFPLHANWQKSDSSVNGEPQGDWRWNSNSRDFVASSPSFLSFLWCGQQSEVSVKNGWLPCVLNSWVSPSLDTHITVSFALCHSF